MTSFLKSATKIRSEFDSSLFFLRSRQNVGHPRAQRSGDVVQLVDHRASDRKVARLLAPGSILELLMHR